MEKASTLRKRNRIVEQVEELTKNPIVKRIRELDIYPKTPSHVMQQTSTGAIGTCTHILLIFK
jgi:hypothetical protein